MRVLALSYLNTAPFVYGLRQKALSPCIHLDFATPAVAAHQLHNDLCDVALVPVAAVPSLPYYQIVGKYCIGAVSAVASVFLCSHVPVAQMQELALDTESRTSALLVKLLLRDYWHITPRYVPLSADFPLHAPQSALLIGDKALLYGGRYPYRYDLAEHWICWTQKPFVFAAWVANKALPDGFADAFDDALLFGLTQLDQAIDAHDDSRFTKEFAKSYLTNNLSFTLDQEKQEGLRLFWALSKSV